MKAIWIGAGVVGAGLFAVLLLPRSIPDVEDQLTTIPVDVVAVDRHLEASEARFENIVPGTEKRVIWNGEAGRSTELSIVYFHGFSASHRETAPLTETIGEQLGANVYLTRFTGHGRNGDALAEARLEDWIADGIEALRIAALIGERVVVIATSTGGSLAVALAADREGAEIAALILVSPNFGPRNKAASLFLVPGGTDLMALVAGPRRTWEPINEGHARYWTSDYPISALIPMMESVRLARRAALGRITAPTMIIYSREDTVVDSRLIERHIDRIGSEYLTVWPVSRSESSARHVLAGDILAPESTDRIAGRIIEFIKAVVIDVPNSHN